MVQFRLCSLSFFAVVFGADIVQWLLTARVTLLTAGVTRGTTELWRRRCCTERESQKEEGERRVGARF